MRLLNIKLGSESWLVQQFTVSPASHALSHPTLGVPWALIHVPLYLPGQMNGESAASSMLTQVVSYSVILTWIYVGTGGSVLLTGLFHMLLNGLTPLTSGLDPFVAWEIRGVVFPIVAILVVALGGFRGFQLSAPAGEPARA